ncbi:MAG: hypothetical protein J7M25_02815 [Deltaproteobacteria bacterium]|nr:hypothetical protein [Deltaproteobacteria bacterium]
MNWLWKMIFRGRLRRLDMAQRAAEQLNQGHLEEAERLLSLSRPGGFLQDVAVHHFVQARLLMERRLWREADAHLETARSLGLNRPSVHLCRALVLARLRRPDEASDALDAIGVEGEGAVARQADALRESIEDIDNGKGEGRIRIQAKEYAARYLGMNLSKVQDPEGGIRRLEGHLSDVDSNLIDVQEGCAAVLGELLIRMHGGGWVLGLEIQDHCVTVDGRCVRPWQLVQVFIGGQKDSLEPRPSV